VKFWSPTGSNGLQQLLLRRRLLGFVQGRTRDEGRGHPTKAVEQRDELRHRRHLDLDGHDRTQHAADRQPEGDQLEAEDSAIHEGRGDRDEHAEGAQEVPFDGRTRVSQAFEAEDEEQRREQIGQVDQVLAHRSVLLLEHAEHAMGHHKATHDVGGRQIRAPKPSQVATSLWPEPAEMTAPTAVIPEIALEPDISGVCRVGGTFTMISTPT
jgi:hypothetical protein